LWDGWDMHLFFSPHGRICEGFLVFNVRDCLDWLMSLLACILLLLQLCGGQPDFASSLAGWMHVRMYALVGCLDIN